MTRLSKLDGFSSEPPHEVSKRRIGLTPTFPLPEAATELAATAIALGRFRSTRWSTDTEHLQHTLDVLRWEWSRPC